MVSMRDLINMVENEQDFGTICQSIHSEFPLRIPLKSARLNEARGIIVEGVLADKIKSTTSALVKKYGDIKYSLLATATTKALSLFQNDSPQVNAFIQKVTKIGKLAINNRALVTILISMVSVVIGFGADHAAAARAADQINQALSGNDLDSILDHLRDAGIDVDAGSVSNDVISALSGLPHNLSVMAQKAAKALHAIEQFKFSEGQNISSSTIESHDFMLDGSVSKMDSHMTQHITIKTPDGAVTLSDMEINMITVDGKSSMEENNSGVQFDLDKAFAGMSADQLKVIHHYIDNSIHQNSVEPSEDHIKNIENMLISKKEDIGLLIGSTLAKKSDGKYRVTISNGRIKIS